MSISRQFLCIAAGVVSCAAAGAACHGSGSYRTCSDDAGNSYTVRQFGNTTRTQGIDAQTGTPWSQTTRVIGDTARHQGTAADGASWGGTSQRAGGATFQRGVDDRGNAYQRICRANGCS